MDVNKPSDASAERDLASLSVVGHENASEPPASLPSSETGPDDARSTIAQAHSPVGAQQSDSHVAQLIEAQQATAASSSKPVLQPISTSAEPSEAAQPASETIPQQQPAAEQDLSFVWPVKSICFPPGSSESVYIVLQNDNGPCSLIALANLLLLSRRIALRPGTKSVSFEEIAERIANELLASSAAGSGLDLTGALEVLPKTRFGLDVNVRFASVDGFVDDGKGELALFELAGAKLLHGWVADEADQETWDAVVTRAGDYDTAVARLVEADELASNIVLPSDKEVTPVVPDDWSPEQRLLVSDALLIRRFLESSASQLTYSGLFALATSALEPGHLAALFRNAHFTVIYRRPARSGEPTLFHLVTDSTLARAKAVVWEGLTDVDGEAASFYDAHLTPTTFEGDFVPPASPSQSRQRRTQTLTEDEVAAIKKRGDADEMLALQMQEAERVAAEDERQRRRSADTRRRSAQPQPPPAPQPIPVPPEQTDVKRKTRKEKVDKGCTVSDRAPRKTSPKQGPSSFRVNKSIECISLRDHHFEQIDMSGVQGQNAGTNDEGVPITKDGNPDMRTKAGREAAGAEGSSGQGQSGAGGTSEDGVPLKKDGTPDQRFQGAS